MKCQINILYHISKRCTTPAPYLLFSLLKVKQTHNKAVLIFLVAIFYIFKSAPKIFSIEPLTSYHFSICIYVFMYFFQRLTEFNLFCSTHVLLAHLVHFRDLHFIVLHFVHATKPNF